MRGWAIEAAALNCALHQRPVFKMVPPVMNMKSKTLGLFLAGFTATVATAEPVRLITLDPGHFHAALVQIRERRRPHRARLRHHPPFPQRTRPD